MQYMIQEIRLNMIASRLGLYCKSVIFCENFMFENSVKRHISDAENSRLGHDLHISVNDRVISAFHEDFIFT